MNDESQCYDCRHYFWECDRDNVIAADRGRCLFHDNGRWTDLSISDEED